MCRCVSLGGDRSGGSFRVDALDLAERKDQSSRVSLRVVAPTAAHLDAIVEGLDRIGAPTIALG